MHVDKDITGIEKQSHLDTLKKATANPYIIRGCLNPREPYNLYGRIDVGITKEKELELMESLKDQPFTRGESITIKENPT